MDDASRPPDDDATEPQTSDGGPSPRVRPVDLRDYTTCRPGEATRTRVHATGRLAVDLWCIEPGASTGVLHYPDRDVHYTVIGGRSWFATDDGDVGLDPLGAILIPADSVHGIDNRSPDPLILLAAASPPGAEPEDAPVADDASAVRWADDRAGLLRRLGALVGRG